MKSRNVFVQNVLSRKDHLEYSFIYLFSLLEECLFRICLGKFLLFKYVNKSKKVREVAVAEIIIKGSLMRCKERNYDFVKAEA